MDISIPPADLPKVWNDIAVDLARKGKFAAATAAMRIAIGMAPEDAELLSNYGNILRRYGRPVEADIAVSHAVQRDLRNPHAWSNMGCVLLDAGEVEGAIAAFDESLRLAPGDDDCLYARACALLQAGRWKEGFAAHECRLTHRNYKTASIPLWDGSPLEGRTLMVHAEQGLGDTIMFHRFMWNLDDRLGPETAHTRYVVPHQLAHLLDASRAGERLEPMLHIPLMSVPAVLGLDHCGGGEPYLAPKHRMALDVAPGTKHKIGLVWKAKANWKQQKPDELWHGLQKSMSLEVLLELTQIRGAQLFGLQVNSDDIDSLGAGHLVRDLQHHIHDFADLASFVSQMDCLVSVDTAPAHLGGALGIPTVVCLHHAGSWQWQTGERTAWYDSVVSVRQTQPGVWPVDRIIEAVREKL